MKSILLVLSLICVTLHANAQYYDDVLTYNINGTPVNGVKIKTNLPFTNSSQMPTIMIEGYAYGNAEPINLTLVYYYYGNSFATYSKISTAGSHNPNVFLAGENGKVVIFIDSKINFQRFHVRAYANGLGQDLAANYQGWTAVDSTLSGSAASTFQVPYQNRFSGTVLMPGTGSWNSAGYVGIGTQTPKAFLDVARAVLDTNTSILGRLPEGNATGTGTFLGIHAYNTQPVNALEFALEHKFYGMLNSAINFYRGQVEQGGFMTFSTNNGTEKMRLDPNGNLGIGTTNTSNYKLAVEGTIGTRRLKITQQATWADFVFQSDYQLPSLQEVENYINTNKHLSGIPSESEVKKEGIDVGEMNKLLLQKVEELTLYMIEEHKQKQKMQDQMQNQIDALQREMKSVNNK
jgi:hypothetical protein